jgi:hypothetical protein
LREDDFAETVTYHPHNDPANPAGSRDSRAISAVVARNSLQTILGNEPAVVPVWSIVVANDSTTGISATEVDIGKDQIELPPRWAESDEPREPRTRTIVRMWNHDYGMLTLECR